MYTEYKAFIDALETLLNDLGIFSSVKIGVQEQVDTFPQATVVPEGWRVESFTIGSIREAYDVSIWIHARPSSSVKYSWIAMSLADSVIKQLEKDRTVSGTVDIMTEVSIKPTPVRELSVAQIIIKGVKVVTYE